MHKLLADVPQLIDHIDGIKTQIDPECHKAATLLDLKKKYAGDEDVLEDLRALEIAEQWIP